MKLEHPEWFFAWTGTDSHVTSMCAWSRQTLIFKVERETGTKWKTIYRNGGRAIKCELRVKK